MKGPLHERLIARLNEAIAANHGITQESVAKVVKMHQTTVGGILKGKGSPLDLDEAAAALAHISDSLENFLVGAPPPPAPAEVRLAAELLVRPKLIELIEVLLDVPQPQLPEVVRLARDYAQLAIGRRTRRHAGRYSGTTGATPRTTTAPKRRR